MAMTPIAPKKSRLWLLSIRQRQSAYSLITIIFLAVIWLEYTTPSAYVFGYLYTGAIILTYRHLGRRQVASVTLAAAGLTLFNLVFPSVELRNLPTLANRLIAIAALLITGYLTERNRSYESEIAQQQAHIRTQAQLAELREDFASTLTHDLKTPLLGAIETIKSFRLEQFGEVSSSQHQVLDLMARSHDDTLHLVEAMLDVYRNDAEGLSLARSPIELRSLLTNTIAALTSLAQSRQVQVNLTPEAENQDFWILGDTLQLRRVFENLLANAISHTPTGTRVKVILHAVEQGYGHQWQVQIQDRGPGIDPRELPYLFVRFYQGHSGRQGKGYGLGLYLSRQIVEAHGGKIWAENSAASSTPSSSTPSSGASSSRMQGATFYCCLPATADDC